MIKRETAKEALRDRLALLGPHFITAVTSIVAAYFLFVSTGDQTKARLVDTCYKRIESLEGRIKEQEERHFKQTVTIAEFKAKLAQRFEDDDALVSFLDALPFPAWFKYVEYDEDENPVFINGYINTAYSFRFGVSKARYFGKTDFEVWAARDVAEAFYRNDLKVLKLLDSKCKRENYPRSALYPVSEKNPLIDGFVCKFPAKINGRLAIAGMSLEPRDIN